MKSQLWRGIYISHYVKENGPVGEKLGSQTSFLPKDFFGKQRPLIYLFKKKKGIFIHRNNENQFQELEKLILPVLLFYPWTLEKNTANVSSVIQQKKSNAKGKTDHGELYFTIILCVYCWPGWVLTAAGVFL